MKEYEVEIIYEETTVIDDFISEDLEDIFQGIETCNVADKVNEYTYWEPLPDNSTINVRVWKIKNGKYKTIYKQSYTLELLKMIFENS